MYNTVEIKMNYNYKGLESKSLKLIELPNMETDVVSDHGESMGVFDGEHIGKFLYLLQRGEFVEDTIIINNWNAMK